MQHDLPEPPLSYRETASELAKLLIMIFMMPVLFAGVFQVLVDLVR